ncbi:membrane protein [Saccharopolyspora subtropica]|uniref:Membrane protein n=1 Tax=Saccharopolyspora thermophila TaxID=89367 RepID=A0A917NCC0_9PSEU|nr:GlsB/YeaQ/YmgE family stress response membrane protein [Saccharopolyspora subtropica]GGI87890.1 membrane protein [Saccharopolyspora subtropica]
MFWNIVGWVIFGLIAGLVARALVPGKDDIGLVRTVLLGIAGSIVGGWLFGLLTVGVRGFEPAGWVGSVVGAVIVLVVYNRITGRKRRGARS